MATESGMLAEAYAIVSIEPSAAPADTEGANWHCYVIAQGRNEIRGYRQGQQKSVKVEVEEIVARLNERRTGKRSRVHLVMPKAKKAEQKQAS
jgi:hypothetical protein